MHLNRSSDGPPFSPNSFTTNLSASSNSAAPPPLLQTAYFPSAPGGVPVTLTPQAGVPYYISSPNSGVPLEFSLFRASGDVNSFLSGGSVLLSSANTSGVHRVFGQGSGDPHTRGVMNRSSGSPLSRPSAVHRVPGPPIPETVPSPPPRLGMIPVVFAAQKEGQTSAASPPFKGYASDKLDPEMRAFHQEQLRRIRQFKPAETQWNAEENGISGLPPGGYGGPSGSAVPSFGSLENTSLPPLSTGALPRSTIGTIGSPFSSHSNGLYGASSAGNAGGFGSGLGTGYAGNFTVTPPPPPVSPEAVLAAHQEEMSRLRLEAVSNGSVGGSGAHGASLQHQLFQHRMDQQERDWSTIVEQFQKLHEKLDSDVEIVDPEDVKRMLDCGDLDEAERQSKRSLETLQTTVEELRSAVRQTNRSKTERKRKELESSQQLQKRHSQLKMKSRVTNQSSASSQQIIIGAMEEAEERRRAFDVESKAREAQIAQLKDVMADLRIDLEEAEGKNREMEQEAQHQTEMASRGWEIEIASYRKQITSLAEDLSTARDDLQKMLLEAERRRQDAEEESQKEMKEAEQKIETLKSQLQEQRDLSTLPKLSATKRKKSNLTKKHRRSIGDSRYIASSRSRTRSGSVTLRQPSPFHSGRTAGSAPAFRAGSPLVPVSELGKRLLPSLSVPPSTTTVGTTVPRHSGYSGIGGLGGIALGGPGLSGLGFGGGGAGSIRPLPAPTTLAALSSVESTPRTTVDDFSARRSGSTAHQNAGIAEAKHAVDALRRQVEDAMKSSRKETEMQHSVEVSRGNPYPARTTSLLTAGTTIPASAGAVDHNSTSQRILEQLQQLLPSLQRLGDDGTSSDSSIEEEEEASGFVQEDAGAMAQLLADLTALRQEVRSYKEENEQQFEKAKTAFESAQSKREQKMDELEEATTLPLKPEPLPEGIASPYKVSSVPPSLPPPSTAMLISQSGGTKENFHFQRREEVIRRVQQNPILNPISE